MLAINCVKAIERVRRRCQDSGGNAFTDTEVLQAVDDALQPIYTTMRLSGQQNEMDRLELPLSSFTTLASNILEYVLPESVGEIHLVEGQAASGNTMPILKATHVLEKNLAQGIFAIPNPIWFFSRHGRPGRIQIRGRTTSLSQINIWYVRRWAPLHYGVATGGGANTLQFPAVPTGDLSLRNDVYVGMDVEITADTAQPTNIGALNRISAYVGATRTATFYDAWPAATSATTVYALVVPLDPESNEYMIEEAAYKLFERLGEAEAIALMERRRARLEERFIAGLQQRSSQDPPRMWNSRGR